MPANGRRDLIRRLKVKRLKVSPEKSQNLSCDTVVANGRYVVGV